MKKFVALILIFVMCVSFAGCGASSGGKTDTYYKIGDTVSSDILEFTLDKAALAIALNNVMDENQVVELGKDSSIAKVTFLAGDIVKDNNINIYDLSAVVSYFGSASTVENGYAKYDLNRDGVIDSKDVAYVLVSWNN